MVACGGEDGARANTDLCHWWGPDTDLWTEDSTLQAAREFSLSGYFEDASTGALSPITIGGGVATAELYDQASSTWSTVGFPLF